MLSCTISHGLPKHTSNGTRAQVFVRQHPDIAPSNVILHTWRCSPDQYGCWETNCMLPRRALQPGGQTSQGPLGPWRPRAHATPIRDDTGSQSQQSMNYLPKGPSQGTPIQGSAMLNTWTVPIPGPMGLGMRMDKFCLCTSGKCPALGGMPRAAPVYKHLK